MRFISLNTGRVYDGQEQIVKAVVALDDDARSGWSMWFVDEARCIYGKMDSVRSNAAEPTLKDRYDLCLYESVASDDPMVNAIRRHFDEQA
jgi:hypothetical protein